ncbi:uncharacterized protein BT62DRAFT_399823 [Guyanagaster necrorhizus]|uniref:Uncharacterized protein n=1 Tax=Guyanagaster necrorhizus TaxID=856835 RepID=A0A9P8AX80_9AGAR|nr:uncharacterized protein BT62DRAFT_399823 [Guyanagaster necrorhizus MCA 3950]KAG7451130.1 hypothetical protein BT62DRAFT_399823 [Guyanagaster necrorhizus MCA 3950]
MKFFVLSASLLSILPGLYALTINTPSGVTECEPSALSWSDGTSPYYLSIYPGGETTGVLESFAATNDTSYTWTCDIAADTSITFAIKDSTGSIAYTDAVTVESGSSTSCASVTGNTDTSTSGSGSTTTATGTDATTTATTGTTTAGTTSSKATSSSSKTTTSSSTTTSASSGAIRNSVTYGVAGFCGLLAALLF